MILFSKGQKVYISLSPLLLPFPLSDLHSIFDLKHLTHILYYIQTNYGIKINQPQPKGGIYVANVIKVYATFSFRHHERAKRPW